MIDPNNPCLFCDIKKLKRNLTYYSNYIFDGNYNKYKVVAKKGKVPIAFKSILPNILTKPLQGSQALPISSPS